MRISGIKKSKLMSRRPRRRVARRKPVAKVSAPLVRAIKSVAKSQLETKYVAEYIAQNLGVTAGASVPADLRRMIPAVAQGTDDHQRIGDKIEPIKGRLSLTVHFQATPTGALSGPYSDCDVHCLVLAVKGARNAATVGVTPANTLLKVGNGTNTDPTVGAFTQTQFLENVNHFPVNTDQFTLLKRFKHRFAKGDYDINGPAAGTGGAQKCMQPAAHTFVYDWKPPAFEYNATVDVFPANHYPVYIMWVTTTDGGPYGGNIYYGSRSELWYKDA